MKFMRALLRGFPIEPDMSAGLSPVSPRVFRISEPAEVANPLARRIVQLADGKSVNEITATIYAEELRRGGWVADIGLCRGMFQQELCDTIAELVRQGCVSLEHETPRELVGTNGTKQRV